MGLCDSFTLLRKFLFRAVAVAGVNENFTFKNLHNWKSFWAFRPRTPPEIDGNVLMTNVDRSRVESAPRRGTHYETIAVELADRDNRDSQRDAVLRVIVPLLTALPKAWLTALIWAETLSGFFDSIACRAFLIKVLNLVFDSTFLARLFSLWRCRLMTDGWSAK